MPVDFGVVNRVPKNGNTFAFPIGLTLKNRKFAPVGKDEIPACDGGRAVTHAVNTKTACNHYRSITELD